MLEFTFDTKTVEMCMWMHVQECVCVCERMHSVSVDSLGIR